FPSLAPCTAARCPAGPLPMHTRSKSKLSAIRDAPTRRRGSFSHPAHRRRQAGPADVTADSRSGSVAGGRQRALELLLGGTVELLEGLGALEEEVHVELPGEADAAVHLDGLAADEARRIARPGLRRGAGERDVGIARVHAPGRAVDRGARR